MIIYPTLSKEMVNFLDILNDILLEQEKIIFCEISIFDICLWISSLWNFGSSTLTPIIVINFLHHQRSWSFDLEVAIKKIPTDV